jgi:hypothetical protein
MGIGQRHSHIMKPKHGPDDPELTEMLQEALHLIAVDDLVQIADELITRHHWFATLFVEQPAPDSLSADHLARLARVVTTSKADRSSLTNSLHSLQQEQNGAATALCAALLNHDNPAGERIEHFVAALEGVDERARLEMATGLLHFTFPETYWWWSRWMWDATTQTGILSLLAGSVHNLRAAGVGEGYEKVGSVTAMSMRFAEGTGLLVPDLVNHPQHPQRALFAPDVFLACAYVVYMYGISSWRLSREFNRLLPPPPTMIRRLLGLSRPREA